MLRTCRQQGVAAVEFALLAVLLVMIAFGGTELGRAFYQYNTLVKATRAAAREFTLVPGPVDAVGNRQSEAQCMAVYGKRPCSAAQDVPVVPGLTMDQVLFSHYPDTLPEPGAAPYAYGCATISGFQFVSWVPWVIPNIAFADIRTCMRQLPA